METPSEFWKHKILKWEQSRYAPQETASPFSRWLAEKSASSVRFRLNFALEQLKPVVKGKKILELGCGSALLAESLLDMGASHYTGIDFASTAIENGRERLNAKSLATKAKLLCGDINEFKLEESDICFSLGLLDWLSISQIENLFKRTQGIPALHSFSEEKLSLTRTLHQCYVFAAYGFRTKSYVPQYYQAQMLAELAEELGGRRVSLVRHPELRFGTFLSSL